MKDFLFILLMLITSISCNSNAGNNEANKRGNSQQVEASFMAVSKVVDGDTFWVKDANGNSLKIRLIGIDAPESHKSARKEIGYFGMEAKAHLTGLLAGKRVRLEMDIKQNDQYGRTLAYAFLPDGTFLNSELVKNGYAMVMTIPPNVNYAEEFIKLQYDAREHNRGLWKR